MILTMPRQRNPWVILYVRAQVAYWLQARSHTRALYINLTVAAEQSRVERVHDSGRKSQRRVRTASEERNVFRSVESEIDSAKRCVTARPRTRSSLALSESWRLS